MERNIKIVSRLKRVDNELKFILFADDEHYINEQYKRNYSISYSWL